MKSEANKKAKKRDVFPSGRFCPDGVATSKAKYFASWHKLIRRIESITGLKCYGYDPDIALFQPRGKMMGPTVHLPLWFAKLLVERAQPASTFPIKSIKKLRFCISA